jgi:hypothetical protein
VTEDYHIGDIVRSVFGNPVDAIVAAVVREEAIAEQVRPPTANEQAAMEAVASKAAALQDEIAELIGDRAKRLKALRAELTGKMIQHGIKELKIAGRPAIELTATRSRKANKKTITAALVKKLGEKEGKMKAANLWNAIEWKNGHSLSIPQPAPDMDDVEPSY